MAQIGISLTLVAVAALGIWAIAGDRPQGAGPLASGGNLPQTQLQQNQSNQEAIRLAKAARTWSAQKSNDLVIREWLEQMKGDLKIEGWNAVDYGNGTYLVSYGYVLEGKPKAWPLEVNTEAQIVRGVSDDEALLRKYGFKSPD